MVLPIGDINPTSRRAFVMGSIAIANIVVFGWFQAPLTGCDQAVFIYRWSVIPRELFTLAPLGPAELEALLGECAAQVTGKNVLLSVVTAMFLHGSLGHLLGNLIFLVVFGNNIEDRLGHGRFLLFYAVGGIGATAAFAALQPASILPLIGASGAIAAILGAYLICFPHARVLTLVPFPLYLLALVIPGVRIRSWWLIVATVGMPAWLLLGGWFVLQYLAADNPVSDEVAYEAHIGGFLAGIALLLLLDRRRSRRGQTPFHPPRGR
jgi:membrane associated rhomboid family serine protease